MTKPTVSPPQVKKEFHKITQHGETRIDPYHWIRGKGQDDWKDVLKDPSVLDAEVRTHLEAENDYTKSHLDQFADLTQTIGDELVSRIIPDDSGVPTKDGNWEYWAQFEKGANYVSQMRRNLTTGIEEVLFDGDKESKGHKFFSVSTVSHSPDHKTLAIGVDTEGSEYYKIKFRDIETGQEQTETLERCSGGVTWAPDSASVYYVECDDEHRPIRLKHHVLGTDPKNDTLLLEETRPGLVLSVGKSFSGEYIFVTSSGQDASEVSFLKADKDPATTPLTLIKPREEGVKYSVKHHGNYFYIHTDADGAREYKMMRTHVDNFAQEHWEDFIPYDDDITLESVTLFKDRMVRQERYKGLPRVIVSDFDGENYTNDYAVKVDDEAYDISYSGGYEFDTDTLRLFYQTPVTPNKTFELNMTTKDTKILRQKVLPNGHDPDEYIVERKLIAARDGEEVPVTIIRHKSTQLDGSAPLYQYGYGSYGHSIDDTFSSGAISIVDRGIIYAVAHIRGGGELGEKWYYGGKEETKMNTFHDFIDVTEGLTDLGYGKKGEVVMEGRSAGGMLMGVVTNLRPDLYKGVIAGVPFVDVLNTMSDPSLPLTPGEWTEWGNPITDPDTYEMLKSYSPYENIQQNTKYPTVLALGGVADYRVTYWEPAKWIARLRDEAEGGPFMLQTEMTSGHFGSAARYEIVREKASQYAFAVNQFEKLGYDVDLKVDYTAKTKSQQKADKKTNLSAPTAANNNPQPQVNGDIDPPAASM